MKGKTINTMRYQTIDKWKGTAAVAGPPGPRGPKPSHCRRPLSFVYGLISHCIDRFPFHFQISGAIIKNLFWAFNPPLYLKNIFKRILFIAFLCFRNRPHQGTIYMYLLTFRIYKFQSAFRKYVWSELHSTFNNMLQMGTQWHTYISKKHCPSTFSF